MIGNVGAIWGLAGVVLLLGYAILRLIPITLAAFSITLFWHHWLVLVLNTGLMAYLEGYRGFQKGFSPRVVARARYLKENPRLLHVLLGPLFCIGYFHATRRLKIAMLSLTIGIIILIVLVHFLDQPWRGIVDAGVIVGLTWGVISLVLFSIRAVTSDEFDHSPEAPD
jgi:hypothetical protein